MYTYEQHYTAVETLMKGARQTTNICPTQPSEEDRKLRASLIYEEAMEQIEGLGVRVWYNDSHVCEPITQCDILFTTDKPYDAQAVYDACLDIMVINTGTAITCGFNLDCMAEGMKAVDNNNLSKLNGPNGPIFREDGKMLKPDNYVSVAAELEEILTKYGASNEA